VIQPLINYLRHEINREAYEVKGPRTKPTVKLIGQDGNAFSIMAKRQRGIMIICWLSAWSMLKLNKRGGDTEAIWWIENLSE
jgi:hypothetical protein